MFNMDDNVVYDLIPSGIINEINREVPDWYINFTNSEQSIAERIPSLQPPQDESSPPNTNTPEQNINASQDTHFSPPTSHPSDDSSNQYLSHKPLIPSSNAQLPSYYKPNTDIRKFHKEFPLPSRFFKKWKDGIPLWSSKKFAKRYKDVVTEQKTTIIQDLLKNDIIQKTSKCSFCSDFSTILKSQRV